MSITSLKLFETLLLKPDEHVVHNLVLRNMLGRGYLRDGSSATSPLNTPERKAGRTRGNSGSAGSKDTAEGEKTEEGEGKEDSTQNTEDTSQGKCGVSLGIYTR